MDHIVEIEMHDGVDENVAKSIADKCAVKKNESEPNCMWASRGYDCLQAQAANFLKAKPIVEWSLPTPKDLNKRIHL